jgi:hypothetical protein
VKHGSVVRVGYDRQDICCRDDAMHARDCRSGAHV